LAKGDLKTAKLKELMANAIRFRKDPETMPDTTLGFPSKTMDNNIIPMSSQTTILSF
jgi:hypothetical protein